MAKFKNEAEEAAAKEQSAQGSSERKGGRTNKRRKFSGKRKGSKGKDNIKSTNDPAWYGQSPELLRDAASIPFSWPTGTPLRSNNKLAVDVVPGVCALKVTPTIGNSLNVNSPANVAASAIYSWVRHANSGHANYDAPDLMMYLLAMSNVYSFVTWMQRVYAYASVYDQRNRYLPQAVLNADGVDFISVRDNLANFRYFLNAYINKVASLAVPATMPIFSRLAFLYSNVYIEGPSIKDQLYFYSPNNLQWYKFGVNSGTGVGELTLTSMPIASGTLATVSDIISFANDLFNAIWEEEDFGIMSGDVLKAYDSNVIKLSPVPEVLPIAPIFDALVLHQMKNAKMLPYTTVSKISQTNGVIGHSITMNTSATAIQQDTQLNLGLSDKVLSTDFDAPGPDVVIESTRMMPAYDSYAGVFHSGTEVLRRVVYAYFDNNGVLQTYSDSLADGIWYEATGAPNTTLRSMFIRNQHMANFKYHPEKMYFGIDSSDKVATAYRCWDIDNYAVLSNEDLIKMHETALLSLFAVPAIAKIS